MPRSDARGIGGRYSRLRCPPALKPAPGPTGVAVRGRSAGGCESGNQLFDGGSAWLSALMLLEATIPESPTRRKLTGARDTRHFHGRFGLNCQASVGFGGTQPLWYCLFIEYQRVNMSRIRRLEKVILAISLFLATWPI